VRRLIASSLGLGLIPRRLWGTDSGAGTFGAALGAGIAGLLLWLQAPWWVSLAVAGVVTVLALWVVVPFSDGDPGWVSIDETAGSLIAVIGLGGVPWVVALVVARLADIFKVLPGIRAAERIPGTLGITADDALAGLYGLAVGWALTALL
jgi:phosphatidylglycerophosphatase A